MYIVRETFTAKPGYASQLAQMMKKEMKSWPGFKRTRIAGFRDQIQPDYD